jgi:hypothetical protein
MTTTVPSVDGEQDPFARTASTRRVGLALAMLIAPWFIVAAETVHAIVSPGGADDLDPAVALAKTADHPTLTAWGGLAGMLGALLLVPAVLGVMRLVRTGAARLGLVGGVLTAAGYVAYFALLFHGVGTEQAMVSVGGSMHQNVEILDKFMTQPWTVWVGPLFVLGNIVGTFLLGMALVRSRAAGRMAGFGLVAWPVLHVVSFHPLFEVAGATLQALGFALAATVLLRAARPAGTAPEPYELLRK